MDGNRHKIKNMAREHTVMEEKCAKLEKLLGEASQEARYYKKISERTGMKRLREIVHLSKLVREHRKAEDALRQSEKKYRSILESIEEGYFETDLDGNFMFLNDSAVKITGYSDRELIGMNYRRYTLPRTSKKLYFFFNAVYRKEKPSKVISFKIKRKDGETRTVELFATLMKNPEGKTIGFLGFGRDITERIQAEQEKKKLEKQLQKAQRLEAIGTLAGGIAHDFNNLLMGIQGYISLILSESDPHDPRNEKIKKIEQSVKSGANLTRQLLGFARGGKYVVRPTNLNRLVHKCSQMLGRTRKEVEIHRNFQKDLWTVEADQGQIEQVLVNLYLNAFQSMPEGGNLYLQTKNVILYANDVKAFGVTPGRYVKASIIDTGTGMDESTQQRIFEPFFTTQKIGRGSGLGLASAFGIIKNHDGFIDFVSKKGKGSSFYVYLPASDKKMIRENGTGQRTTGDSGSILLVDDENFILDVVKYMLEACGYEVLTAESGKAAIEIYGNHYEKIDLVILDMIMPDLGGGAVYDQMKEINPGIKVLLSSGYSLQGQASAILARGCNGFIQKPFDMLQLSRKVNEILKNHEKCFIIKS